LDPPKKEKMGELVTSMPPTREPLLGWRRLAGGLQLFPCRLTGGDPPRELPIAALAVAPAHRDAAAAGQATDISVCHHDSSSKTGAGLKDEASKHRRRPTSTVAASRFQKSAGGRRSKSCDSRLEVATKTLCPRFLLVEAASKLIKTKLTDSPF
jgi:hypothetical protein